MSLDHERVDWTRLYSTHNLDCKNVSESIVEKALLGMRMSYWRPEDDNLPGADFVTDNSVIEVKDWAPQVHLTLRRICTHVLPRFLDVDPRHFSRWILVISCSKIPRRVRQLLRGYNIELVWIAAQITSESTRDVSKLWLQALLGLFNIQGLVSIGMMICLPELSQMCALRDDAEQSKENAPADCSILAFFNSGSFPGQQFANKTPTSTDRLFISPTHTIRRKSDKTGWT